MYTAGTDMSAVASVKIQQVRVNAWDSNDITADSRKRTAYPVTE